MTAAAHPGTLTVTTFNVLHADRDRTARALTAAAGLNASAPDLVLLQELPFEHHRSSAYLDTLTAATGLDVAHAAPLTAPRPHTADRSGLGPRPGGIRNRAAGPRAGGSPAGPPG